MFEASYGTVERALAAAYGVPEHVREAGFRSALSNLQKLGALGQQARVGRGAPLKYGPTELHRLVFALELSELGVPPATAVALVNSYWESKFKGYAKAAEQTVEREEPSSNDVIVYLGGVSLRTGILKDAQFPGVPNINSCTLKRLPDHLSAWMSGTVGLPQRALLVNLSARLRQFHTALAKTYTAEAIAERRAPKSSRAVVTRQQKRRKP